MIVLGIEPSCDETAAAVVSDDRKIHSNIVYSQFEEHHVFGGVVPEIAARAHLQILDGVIRCALAEANFSLSDIDGIAATGGPGSHRSVVEIKQVFTVGKFRVGHDVSINSYKLQATSCNAGGCGGKYIAPWPRYLP